MTSEAASCPCGSGNPPAGCCVPYMSLLGLDHPVVETVLLSWLDRYSAPIHSAFRRRAQSLLFRISLYADLVFDQLCPIGFRPYPHDQDKLDQATISAKHNIMLTLLGATVCLAQGLFLQSGVLIRSCIEDAFVILDLSSNDREVNRFLEENYSPASVLTRVKRLIPRHFLRWYGHYSANFAHFGPLHSAPYMPRACYPDNYVICSGLRNLLLGTHLFHVVLERAHFDQLDSTLFWHRGDTGEVEFVEDNSITDFIQRIQKDTLTSFPPDEKKPGFVYGPESYRTK